MRTENDEFEITVTKLDTVVCLDFRTQPRDVDLGKTGYGSIHFQLAPKDAEKLGALLQAMGDKK